VYGLYWVVSLGSSKKEQLMPTNSQIRIERVEGALMSVNSYVIEGPEGLIIVDGQLTVSDAKAVRAVVDGFGRPVAAMVITHGHSDHYAGAATMLAGLNAPINRMDQEQP
jgi:glyoxylase-like metal-dependent hydrolase (beta-lactamase superfamily II)